ncbi:Zim17p NDAI_0A06270 [Naumovozyma dairenensis CBS 421]|uniref:DNL-type domain-containing protein n=1 Tax=Naumovozyma dairenensis (strain ATCC 10597 / BCRC 20456 / CBS 421 / NBRC 0211 / NRRL Y-12639) TaxID=1071378 RepID=G0W4P3_NAUDC|nr:hypothetical protein NDAI_0A06270 [Naumovozyma dairenensis CBS 421]CCD22781.1 hypothetical protein NDAI_0A06270 [Naumovozyma dairenensis CBS 421]
MSMRIIGRTAITSSRNVVPMMMKMTMSTISRSLPSILGSSLTKISLYRQQCLPHSLDLKNNFSTTIIRSKDDTKDDRGQTGQKLGSFKVDKPQLMIAFTCKKCDTRSSHTMSKQAYTKGTVLITCPGCKNRHLIADHLKIFNDDHITIEDIMKSRGEDVSQSTDDLIFEDIPESLRETIGHYAKDAPEHMKEKLNNEEIHSLPPNTEEKL